MKDEFLISRNYRLILKGYIFYYLSKLRIIFSEISENEKKEMFTKIYFYSGVIQILEDVLRGRLIERTPSTNLAPIFAVSTALGRVNERVTLP